MVCTRNCRLLGHAASGLNFYGALMLPILYPGRLRGCSYAGCGPFQSLQREALEEGKHDRMSVERDAPALTKAMVLSGVWIRF